MNISAEKRFLSLLLAVIMVVLVFPATSFDVFAAGSRTQTGNIGDIGWSALIPTTSDGSSDLGGVAVDGTSMTITAQAEAVSTDNCGSTSWSYNQTSVTLTLTNNMTTKAVISFSYTPGNKMEIDGTEYTTSGTFQSVSLTPGATVTVKFYSTESGDDSTHTGNSVALTITELFIVEDAIRDMTFASGINGTVSVDGAIISTNTTKSVNFAAGISVSASAATGYKFIAWVDETETVLSTKASDTLRPAREDMTVSAVFVPVSESGHWIGNKKIFTEFQEALDAATVGDKQVKLIDNCTLTRDYIIPSGVSVLIPFDQALTAYGAEPEVVQRPSTYNLTPKVYSTLTLDSGVTLTVNGSLEVSAKHLAAHGGQIDGGRPWEYYGYVSMGSNSHIDIKDGGTLYAWGYITGSGKITANGGAKIYEKFQVGDYRGGSITSAIVLSSVFPFNQYYVQNVEVEEIIHPGASLICHAGIYLSELTTASINFIGGTDAMFSISNGTVMKRYDNATDRLIIEMNGIGAMNPISLMDYNTANFILPVNHNITVNLNSGIMQMNQDIMMQPGAEVNVNREAYLILASGKKAYLMDKDNWGNYCFGKPMQQISWVPLKNAAPNIRTADNMTDAKININGTVVVQGQLYASTAGALIESSDKTGVLILMNNAPSGTTNIKQSAATKVGLSNTTNISVGAALLTNANGTTVNTKGAAQYTTYVYDTTLDKWVATAISSAPSLTLDANGGFITGETTTSTVTVDYQTTAQSYLPLSIEVDVIPARANYTFVGWSTAKDATEAQFKAGEYIVISENTTLYAIWRGVPVEITWVVNGVSTTQEVEYGKVPTYPGEAPSKASDNQYHYILGWATTENGSVLESLPVAIGGTTYYAVFTAVAHDKNEIVDGKHYCSGCDYATTWGSCSDTNKDHKCDIGGEGIVCHQGTLSAQSAQSATCAKDGWNVHYQCSCGKYYEDAQAQILISDINAWKTGNGKIPATGEHVDSAIDKDHVCDYGCGVILEAHNYTYDVENHKCICGDIATFTLTVYNSIGETTLIATIEAVPYGANLMQYLNEFTLEDVVNSNGKYEFRGWIGLVGELMQDISFESTMPAEDYTLHADFTFTGWVTLEDGIGYVVRDEALVGWQEINGAWYYFDDTTNARAEGISRVPYPTVAINGATYASESNDGEFIDSVEAWFVFGADGKFLFDKNGFIDHDGMTRYAVNGMIPWHYGLATDGVDYYYFIGDQHNGGNKLAIGDVYMIRANELTINEKPAYDKGIYTFDQNGRLCLYDGVVKVADAIRYYYNYCFTAKVGLIRVGDGYIYVRSSTSELVANRIYYVAGDGIVAGTYAFDENGYMIDPVFSEKNGIYFEDGAYYYYASGLRTYKGLIVYTGTASDGTEYKDAYIYVRSNGQLATGKYWMTKTNDTLEAKIYMFNEQGIMNLSDGIVEENGGIYYYVDGILAKGAGLVQIGENYYYVRTSGEVVNNCSYWITNTNDLNIVAKTYLFDATGAMQDVEFKNTDLNGVVDGYYYVNGQIQYGAGPIEWNENVYYVRSNGQVATGKYWTTASNDILPSGIYVFDETGKLIEK